MLKINYAKINRMDKDVVFRMFYFLNTNDYFDEVSLDYKGFYLKLTGFKDTIYPLYLKKLNPPSKNSKQFYKKYCLMENND